MMDNLKIYHKKYHEGTIIKYEDGIYEIDFNGERRRMVSGQWTKSLFLDAKDAYKKYEELDISPYTQFMDMESIEFKLIIEKEQKNRTMNIKSKLRDKFWVDDEEEYQKFHEIKQESISKKITEMFTLSQDMVTSEERCVTIVCIKPVNIKEKRYLQIIAIDAKTAKVLTITDNYGYNEFHSYNSDLMKLGNQMTTIKAKFKYVNSENKNNIVKIVSAYEVIGSQSIFNISKLNVKYSILSNDHMPIIANFYQIRKYSEANFNKPCVMIVKFTDTIIKKDIKFNAYSIKMENHFPLIFDKQYTKEELNNKHFRGWGLITWKIDRKGKVRYSVSKMIGEILSDHYVEIKNKNKDLVNAESIFEEDFFYDEIKLEETYTDEEQYYYNEYLDRNIYYGENLSDDDDEVISQCQLQEYAYFFSDDEYIEGREDNE